MGAGKPPPPPQELKLPRALLQQHCQREGMPLPRFERLAPGGFRLAHAGIRYNVVLESAAPARGGAKRKGVQVKLSSSGKGGHEQAHLHTRGVASCNP